MWFTATAIGRRQIASVIFLSPSISPTARAFPQFHQQKRTVYSKYNVPLREKDLPEPWPYKDRGYRTMHQFIDFGVRRRLNENSKLIVVEGNVGSGKSKLAAELADHLGFYHIPDPPFDEIGFIDSYGEDRRPYYHLLPETCRRFDTRMFCEQPNHRNVAKFQLERFQCRTEAYANALAHILNTGQGVVLERHYQADIAFLEAMYNKGYVGDHFRYHYHKFVRRHVMNELKLEAHLIIYLDCPVSKCLENIKKYHKPWSWKNSVMDYTYLEYIEKSLKGWLKEYSRHAEILTYDCSEGCDARAVMEDIEGLELDDFKTHENEKFETWFLMPTEMDFTEFRTTVTSKKWDILEFFYDQPPAVEELWISPADAIIRMQVHDMIFGPYAAGFRLDRNDDPAEMAMSSFRDWYSNKKWTEYFIRDIHHTIGHDPFFYKIHDETPTIPEDFLNPQSPYKSDGGCLAGSELFLDNNTGRMTRIPH